MVDDLLVLHLRGACRLPTSTTKGTSTKGATTEETTTGATLNQRVVAWGMRYRG